MLGSPTAWEARGRVESRAHLSDIAGGAVDIGSVAARRDSPEPIQGLLADAIAATAAEVGWLVWHGCDQPIICVNKRLTRIALNSISDFPEPPTELLVVGASNGLGPWSRWCRDRGIGSCIVSPIRGNSDAPGELGLVAARPDVFGPRDRAVVAFACRLLVHAQRSESRIDGLTRRFNEVSRALSGMLVIPHLRNQPSYRRLAQAVGDVLDASYFHIAIVAPDGQVSVKASGGHRPPKRRRRDRWDLGELTRCAAVLSIGRPVVLHRSEPPPSSPAEWRRFFSPTTRTGIILPLVSGSLQGLLLIGEERASRFPPVQLGRLALLEFVANRVADILALGGFVANMQISERGRQIRLGEVAERQRLAQAVHDEVGQALTALLLRLRWDIGRSRTSVDELRIFEATARDALEATRALAFRLRQPDPQSDPIGLAHEFAEPVLEAIGCQLSWMDERRRIRMDSAVAREIGRVIRESVTNIARHSHAKAVEIRLESADGLVRVSIRDDGSGFSPETIGLRESGQGIGLLENRESLQAVGGRFAITSSPGHGTLVIAEAPRRRGRRHS